MIHGERRARLLPWCPITWVALWLIAPASAAPLPGGFERSGWYQFEIIVMVDTRAETLESETWPMLPTVGYPAKWRWLQDPALRATLAAQHPDASVSSSPSGHLTIRHPLPSPPDWISVEGLITEGDMAAIDELIELGKGTDTTERRERDERSDDLSTANPPVDPGPVLPFEATDREQETSSLTPLQSLGLADEPMAADAPSVAVPLAAPESTVDLEPVVVTARGIPTPTPFLNLPLDQLGAGLDRYQRTSEDQLVAAVSWLQGPTSDSRPILLDSEAGQDYPVVQGFIQLIPRGNTWRLGLNFWANTEGSYLPNVFDMPGPPPSPHRVADIQPPGIESSQLPVADLMRLTGRSLSTETTSGPTGLTTEATAESEWGSAQAALPAESQPGSALRQPVATPERPIWPWRHLIHVADTIPLTENRLRYYDHPVIKVLAIWRELSWYELFRQGERERDAAESAVSAGPIDTEAATDGA